MRPHPLLRRPYLLPAAALLAVGLIVAGVVTIRSKASATVEGKKVLISGFSREPQASRPNQVVADDAPAAPHTSASPGQATRGTVHKNTRPAVVGTPSPATRTSTGGGSVAPQRSVNRLAPGTGGGVGGGVVTPGALANLPNPSIKAGSSLYQVASGFATGGTDQNEGGDSPALVDSVPLPEAQGQWFTADDLEKLSQAEAALREDLEKTEFGTRPALTVEDLMIARYGFEKYQAYALELARKRLAAREEGQL